MKFQYLVEGGQLDKTFLKVVDYDPIPCKVCGGILNCQAYVDYASKIWTCPMCHARNGFPQSYQGITDQVSECTSMQCGILKITIIIIIIIIIISLPAWFSNWAGTDRKHEFLNVSPFPGPDVVLRCGWNLTFQGCTSHMEESFIRFFAVRLTLQKIFQDGMLITSYASKTVLACLSLQYGFSHSCAVILVGIT